MRQGGRERSPFPKLGEEDLTLTLNSFSLAMGFPHGFYSGPKTTRKAKLSIVAFLRKSLKDLSLTLIFGHDSK